jgi:hypothetical protein
MIKRAHNTEYYSIYYCIYSVITDKRLRPWHRLKSWERGLDVM